MYTRESLPLGHQKPRLSRLGDLLADWEVDARVAHEARTIGKPRGSVNRAARSPASPLLTASWGAHSRRASTSCTAARELAKLHSPCRWRLAAERQQST